VLSHADVANAAVIGVPHAVRGESVVALVVLRPWADTAPEAILDHAKGRLAKFEVPKRVVIVDGLPTTTTGKTRKALLREEYQDLFAE
jgi:acyl-CoA synthetase (AMP-forming)/AMP-acid ligase II